MPHWDRVQEGKTLGVDGSNPPSKYEKNLVWQKQSLTIIWSFENHTKNSDPTILQVQNGVYWICTGIIDPGLDNRGRPVDDEEPVARGQQDGDSDDRGDLNDAAWNWKLQK